MRPRMLIRGRVAHLLAILCLVACQANETVDGWPLGIEIPCEMTATEADARVALQADLMARFGSSDVSAEQCRYPGPYAVAGHPVYWESTPGGVELHLVAFPDGTRHVVALSCPARTPPPPGSPPVIGPRCIVMQLPAA